MAAQNLYITKKYDKVTFYSKDRLTGAQKQEIQKNISGLIVAKIGDYLVNSTDNLIITKLVSLVATGIYSNYLLIRNLINGYISALFAGVTAGIGNIVAVENDEKKLDVFNTMFFIAFFIYSIEATCFMCLFNPFIGEIWIGEKYLFRTGTVAIIVINNYLTGLRMPLITMKVLVQVISVIKKTSVGYVLVFGYSSERMLSFSANIVSIYSRVLLNLGTLCCPPNFPLCASQSWNNPSRATITSNGCRAISFHRFAS